jgi:hypothetical protein
MSTREIKKEADKKMKIHILKQQENQPYINSKKKQLTR